MTNDKERIQTSRFMSMVLRHKPKSIGLELDPQGWADVADLIDKARPKRLLTEASIRHVVANCEKQRFKLSDDGRRIRANQGHSIKVEIGLEPITPPDVLFHGTAKKSLAAIRRKGLKRMRRHHVHLSSDLNTAVAVGRRHGEPVVLEVSAGRMHDAGIPFYRSDNGVWLTEAVAPEFLREI